MDFPPSFPLDEIEKENLHKKLPELTEDDIEKYLASGTIRSKLDMDK